MPIEHVICVSMEKLVRHNPMLTYSPNGLTMLLQKPYYAWGIN